MTNSYVYPLLKRVIVSENPLVPKERIELLLMNFFTTGQLDQAQFDELSNLLNPPVTETTTDETTTA